MNEAEILSLVATIKVKMDDLEKGLKKAKEKADDFADKASAKIGKNLGGALSDFGDGLIKVGNRITSLGKTASIVTGAVGGVLAGAFTKAKSYIETYESAMATFRNSAQIGEEGAKTLYNSLLGVAKRSAYARENFLLAGQSMVAMGLDADKTTKYIQAITDSCAKAGKSGTEIQELSQKFALMSVQTNLYTRDLNSLSLSGIPILEILATKYHTTEEAIKEMASQGLLPAKESLDLVTQALEETNEQSEYFKFSAHGMAEELKKGTLTGTLDALNTSFRTFSLRLLDLDPETKTGEENIKTLNAAISSFGEVLEKIGTKFSFVGDMIKRGLEDITTFLNNFNASLENVPQDKLEMIVKIVGTIALAGPVLIVLGKTVTALGTAFKFLGDIISPLISGFGALAGAVGGVAPALGIVIAVVVALISVFEFLKQNWDTVVAVFTGWLEKTGIVESLQNMKNSFNEFMSKLSGLHDLLVVVGGIIMAVLTPAIVTLMGVFNGLVSAFDGFMTMLGGVVDVLNGLGEILMGIFTFDGEKILSGFSTLFTGIENIFVGAFDMIIGYVTGFIDSTWGLLTSFWNEIFPKVQEWFSNLWTNIETWFTNTWNSIIQWFNDLPYNLGVALGLVIGTLAQWGINAYNWVTQEVPKIINNIVDWFKKLPSKIWEWLTNTIDKIKTWISDMQTKGREGALNFFNSIVGKIKELPSKMGEMAKNIVNGLVNGIKNSMSWVKEQVGKFAKGILDGMKSALGIHSPSKLFEKEIGINIALGVSEGWQDALGKVKDEMEKSFNAEVVDNLNMSSAEITGAYSINPYTAETETSADIYTMLIDLRTLLSEYLPLISNKKVVLDTGVLVGELTPQIDDTLGIMSSLKSRGN